MNRSNGEAVIKKWDYRKLFSCKKKKEIMPLGKMWMELWGHYAKWNRFGQRKTNTIWVDLYVEPLKTRTHSNWKDKCLPEAEGGMEKTNGGKKEQTSSFTLNSWGCNIHHGSQYCIVHLKVAKGVQLKRSHHKKKNFNYVKWWVLAKLTVLIISQ